MARGGRDVCIHLTSGVRMVARDDAACLFTMAHAHHFAMTAGGSPTHRRRHIIGESDNETRPNQVLRRVDRSCRAPSSPLPSVGAVAPRPPRRRRPATRTADRTRGRRSVSTGIPTNTIPRGIRARSRSAGRPSVASRARRDDWRAEPWASGCRRVLGQTRARRRLVVRHGSDPTARCDSGGPTRQPRAKDVPFGHLIPDVANHRKSDGFERGWRLFSRTRICFDSEVVGGIQSSKALTNHTHSTSLERQTT
jgi:hypothetical protein